MNEVLEFFKSINDTTIKHLQNAGVNITNIQDQDIANAKFYDITAYVSVSGIIRGGFIFSVEKKLAHALVPKFVFCEVSEEEIPEYAGEVIAEIANMISANALIGREVEDIFLGTPLMILGNNAKMNNISPESLGKKYATPDGDFQCLYVPVIRGEEIAIKID